MAFTTVEFPVESVFGVTIPNTLLAQEAPTQRLLVLLPGRAYTNDHPVMYHLMKIALQRGYDVLLISYGFHTARRAPLPDQMPAVLNESLSAVRAALAHRPYTHLCVAGKSMGTLFAPSVAAQAAVASTSVILFTPLQNVHQQTAAFPTLAVIGTADPAYPGTDFAPLPHVTWQIYEDLDHGLEVAGDWRVSLAHLTDIMERSEVFLAAQEG